LAVWLTADDLTRSLGRNVVWPLDDVLAPLGSSAGHRAAGQASDDAVRIRVVLAVSHDFVRRAVSVLLSGSAVLCLLARGRSDAEVGSRLGLNWA
jgi:hypothetical protein